MPEDTPKKTISLEKMRDSLLRRVSREKYNSRDFYSSVIMDLETCTPESFAQEYHDLFDDQFAFKYNTNDRNYPMTDTEHTTLTAEDSEQSIHILIRASQEMVSDCDPEAALGFARAAEKCAGALASLTYRAQSCENHEQHMLARQRGEQLSQVKSGSGLSPSLQED